MIIPTDSTESVFSVRGGEEGFVRLTRLSDQRLAGYEVAYESSGNVRQVVYTSDRKRHKSGTIPRAKRQPVLRNAKPLLASAQRLATEMTVHAVASELIDLANDGYRLLD